MTHLFHATEKTQRLFDELERSKDIALSKVAQELAACSGITDERDRVRVQDAMAESKSIIAAFQYAKAATDFMLVARQNINALEQMREHIEKAPLTQKFGPTPSDNPVKAFTSNLGNVLEHVGDRIAELEDQLPPI